jgi:hypothetical protein
MKRPENDKWLDEALSETIGSEKSRTDFEEWKQRHPEAVEMLTARTSRTSQEVLEEIERRQTMSVKVRSWKYAATVALLCTGVVAAAVVGIKIHKWRVVDKHPEAGYLLLSEDGRFMTNVPESWADNPEHAVEVKEELDLLKQQDKRKLVGVTESKVNGQHDHWWFSYEYTLSDGRVIRTGERDPDDNTPMILVGELREEASRCFHEILKPEYSTLTTDPQTGEKLRIITPAEGVILKIYDQVVQGQVFSFQSRQFALSDGTTVTYSFGRRSEDGQNAIKTVVSGSKEAGQTGDDLQEIAILREQDKRELIAVDELLANGELDRKVFVYQYQLSDGRTKDMREGAGGGNYILSKAQRQEWVQLRNAGSGEDLGTYEEKVMDRLFVFKRQRFTLSDGTELIWSYGTLKDDQ